MKEQLKNAGTDRKILRNRNIKRTYLMIHGIQDVVNTAPATSNIDLSKLRVTLSLNQLGKTITSTFNGIPPVIVGQMRQGYQSISAVNFASSGTTCAGETIVTAGASTYAETLLIVPLTFEPIILKGNDNLTIDFDLGSALFSSALNDSSKVYLCYEDGSDLHQLDMSLPQYTMITSEKSQVEFTYPSCSQVYLLDSGGTDDRSDIPWDSIEIKSKHFNDRYDKLDLISLNKLNQVSPLADLNNNFNVVDATESALVDVNITIALDPTLITTNNQFLYVENVGFNPNVTRRAVDISNKINYNKTIQRGVNLHA